jgi:hypothetical protein
MSTLLFILLILILIGVIPIWPHSQGWGPWPGGAVGILRIILVILLVTGRL